MDRPIFPFLWMRGEEESILRREIAKISECGIRAVCVEARPHDDFCGEGWWHDMDIVLDEARKRDLRVWILDDRHFPTGYANGLIETKYPERKKQYLACTVADVFGASRQLTLNVGRMLKPSIGFWEIGNPVDCAERANNRLLALTALRFEEGRRFHEDAVDLTGCVDGQGFARFTLPEGAWRVHALYLTRTDGGNPAYINMLDAASAHTQIEGVYEAHYARYGAEFGKTIAGFFSDEPQFGNISEQVFDTKLGRARMPLPWSGEMESMLRERHGDSLNRRLPFLFAESAKKTVEPQIRYDYMDCATRLYAGNFSRPIGDWCRAHGVEYIGHVVEDNGVHSRLGLGAGHWFRAMEGQDMAGIDVIGSQYCFGAPYQTRKGMTEVDGEFFHYALGKLGASGGHLDPKKKGRTMCELFGAYGWGFGVRDMKRLLDHLLCCGVNRLVPHAFSMAEYPDYDCPPHFYARGHNPEFPYFARLMQYADGMCKVLSGGLHAASVAVLYDGELDWSGEHLPMQKLCRVLTEHQVEFDIVCLDMLRDLEAYRGCVSGKTLNINGVSFGALLVPWAENIPQSLLTFAGEHPEFPVLFCGGRPDRVLRDGSGERDPALPGALPAIALEDLPGWLETMGLRPIRTEPAFAPLRVYHCRRDGKQIFLLMNESANERFEGEIRLPAAGPLVWTDLLRGSRSVLGTVPEEDGLRAGLELFPGECCLLTEEDGENLPLWRGLSGHLADCRLQEDLSGDWRLALAPAADPPVFGEAEQLATLTPVSDRHPGFSGLMRYEKSLVLPEKPEEAWLVAKQVFEVMRLTVNGEDAGICLTPPYALPIAEHLRAGENRITVEVSSTPARDQLNIPQPPFDFMHEALEPTGMFGSVTLYYR
ncbi:MAG: glycoside hydrolase family 2 [Oscillospiraceae bacterium]|nr:glycoside hydrolase family 2 [Oscillospiraceae bacterium]